MILINIVFILINKKAKTLGVSINNINATLSTMFIGIYLNNFIDR